MESICIWILINLILEVKATYIMHLYDICGFSYFSAGVNEKSRLYNS